jgi:hypothetical protein
MVGDRSDRLSARIEELASALRASGADPDAASRLLGHAAAAALQAVTLDVLLERPQQVAAPVETVAVPEPEELERQPARDVPLAA